MEVLFHSSDFLLPSPSSSPPNHRRSSTYALVLLNQRLPKFTPLLWKHAQLRLCADGGANRVFDDLPLMFPHLDALDVRNRFGLLVSFSSVLLYYKPDVIRGDMDSIRTEVLEFYAKQISIFTWCREPRYLMNLKIRIPQIFINVLHIFFNLFQIRSLILAL
ncbi:thiamine pyrophosphokinase 1 isoform X6 [Cucumis melo]|uniref:Thiamine pyrophosphokinase 1 isoform X6 n=1 Tax=Cucumis melo TaxID=3656 RepID=A0ABM3KZJ0_CUCME|nr:thiamine pyrophosphokinase 1 isoform X6 [Cucumis melo]